jgi:acyl dehydratase
MPLHDPSMRHYEDMEVGRTYAYGAYEVTKDEIFAFAHAYDPQPHHIDEEAAKLSLVKGLCASGWHSCAIFMRMLYDGLLADSASLGGPAIDEVKWLKPVRPGHILKARSTSLDKRPMRSRPGVGICRMRHEILNQSDELLMTMENSFFIAIRDPAAVAAASTEASR